MKYITTTWTSAMAAISSVHLSIMIIGFFVYLWMQDSKSKQQEK